MRLIVNWTVKYRGKRYEAGETVVVDEEAAEVMLGSGACRYYDGPDAGKGDAKKGAKKGAKADEVEPGPDSDDPARAE